MQFKQLSYIKSEYLTTMKSVLLTLLFLAVTPYSFAQHTHNLKPGKFDGFILKYSPMAILPMPASEIRLGAEYCIDGRLGIGLDLGYVVHFLNSRGYNTGNGFAIHPDARYYLGHSQNARLYCGVQGFYRTENFGSGRFEYIEGTNRFSAFQTSAARHALGIAAHGGIALAGPHFRVEFGTGIGVKGVNYDRSGLSISPAPQSGKTANQAPGEYYVLDHKTLPYVVLDIKICLRTQ